MRNMDTDQPRSTREEDRFQRYEFSKRVARIVMGSNLIKSLVIGLYGKWGEGKTSVMNFIKAELSADVVVVNFNPWLFSSEEQLIKSFFSSLAYELGKSLNSGKEKVGKVLSEYGEAIGVISNFIGLSGSGLKAAGDLLKEVSIELLKKRVDEMIQLSGKKIVVCVDDIDRLDIKEIQYIFKLIKLVADFPRTTYVLAFDEELVAKALAPQYGDKTIENGYTFLEKIIQLPLRIPKATRPLIKKYVLEMLDEVIKDLQVELSQNEVSKFRSTFDDFYLPQIDNPRLATRFCNAVYFALPLLYGEVNTTDLILLEGMKVLFPTAYDFTRSNSSLFLAETIQPNRVRGNQKTQEDVAKEVNLFLQGMPQSQAASVKEIWKKLFLQYRYAVGNIGYYEGKWRDWYRLKRLCSGAYFERYFTYVVGGGDISDVIFQQLLYDLDQPTIAAVAPRFEAMFSASVASDIVFKLRLWETELNDDQSKNLSMLFARWSANFPVEVGEFAAFTTRAEAAKTVARVSKNLPVQHQAAHLITVFLDTPDLGFCLEILYWFLYKDRDMENADQPVSPVETCKMELTLLDRFRAEIPKKGFFEILPEEETLRVLNWWKAADPDELQVAVEAAVASAPEQVIRLIKVFTPTIMSWGGKGHRTFKSGFDKDNYASMADTIDVGFAYRTMFDAGWIAKEFDLQTIPNCEPLTDEDLGSIFMLFYEAGLHPKPGCA